MAYNPQVTHRGDLHISRGIEGLGRSIGQFLEKRTEERKRLNRNAKVASAMVKANPEALDQLGMDIEDFEGLSAQDKVSAAQGLMQGQQMKTASAQLADVLGRGRMRDEQMQGLRQSRIRQAEQARQTSNLFEAFAGDEGNLGQAIEKNSGADPRAIQSLLQLQAAKEAKDDPLAKRRLEIAQQNADTQQKLAELREEQLNKTGQPVQIMSLKDYIDQSGRDWNLGEDAMPENYAIAFPPDGGMPKMWNIATKEEINPILAGIREMRAMEEEGRSSNKKSVGPGKSSSKAYDPKKKDIDWDD